MRETDMHIFFFYHTCNFDISLYHKLTRRLKSAIETIQLELVNAQFDFFWYIAAAACETLNNYFPIFLFSLENQFIRLGN